MIQEVIDNLISLEENLKSQRDGINAYTQDLAKTKFKEILEEIGVDYDVDKLTFAKGYRDKNIYIEHKQDNYYRNLKMEVRDRKSTRLNSSHSQQSRMPSSA